jgi:hypothetical protein
MSKPKKPFSDLMGTRIIIENFAKPAEEVKEEKVAGTPNIILLDKDQKEVDAEKKAEELVSTERFTILQVGEGCNPKFQAGQEVFIEKPERYLSPENAEVIMEEGEIIGFIIAEKIIAGIY